MVDWKDPEVVLVCMKYYAMMLFFVLGAISWFYVETWRAVEGALLTGRSRFTPAHVPYLTARYGQIITLILFCISTHLPAPVLSSCKHVAFSRITVLIGNTAMVASSSNLGLRAFTLWENHRAIRAAMIVCCFGHFVYGILMGMLSVKAVWNKDHTECALLTDNLERAIAGFYLYTLGWDTVTLALTILALREKAKSIMPSKRPSVLNVLTHQGVWYAVIMWLVSIPMTITILLNLNVILNIFLSTPGGTISVIASSKMVLSLLKLKEEERKEALDNAPAATHSEMPVLTTNFSSQESYSVEETQVVNKHLVPGIRILERTGLNMA
ncbi:hypothetical protein BDY19DRAFT_994111 [Irpex rosettiformis]|uniref:Uncharacterized protein n=1 Tax=Irpex rosettiformis TaxID=378272 RepID=A0ACB8U1S8_9APHY|nr:hypothetical protein BDY19DRAFT_994111 [Irpex rosettiformis]